MLHGVTSAAERDEALGIGNALRLPLPRNDSYYELQPQKAWLCVRKLKRCGCGAAVNVAVRMNRRCAVHVLSL